MPLITVKDLIEAKAYEDERSALDDALRCLLRCRPELRERVAVHQYRTGDVSLARAAYLAGVSWRQMRDILQDHGVPLRLGPEFLDEAREEVAEVRRHLG
ncbi:MAG: UPF0175 family protein [Planctomycetes bacterium]|nr:UPF0175 family protein [Planctomycetota bacterium]